jgi:membrane-associated phospholipid phosphatase
MNGDVRKSCVESTPRQAIRGFWWIAAILTGLSVAVLPFDFGLAHPDNLEYLPGDLTRFVDLSELFSHGFGVMLVVIGICFLASHQSKFIPRIVMCAFWPAFGVLLLKSLIGRYRPIFYFDEQSNANFPAGIADTWLGWMPGDRINVAYGISSFPSAHTATGWGLAIGLAWVFPKGRWLFFGVAVLGSIQRVTSFAHWPSDVFCGAAIAFVMAGAITQNWGLGYFLGRFENRNNLNLLVDENSADRRAA